MSWIKIINVNDATGRLRKLYDQIKSPDGHIDNILKVHSLRPATLLGHLSLYKAAIHSKPNALSPRERELVGVCVSLLNKCEYCVKHHTAGLARHIGNEALAQKLVTASVSESDDDVLTRREKALCLYARKLTQTPGAIIEQDVKNLSKAGFDDGAVLDVNQIVAYFAYANRTVLGLGVTTDGEPLGQHPDEEREDFQHG